MVKGKPVPRSVFDWTGFACPCTGAGGDCEPPAPNPDEYIAAYEALLAEQEEVPPCLGPNGRFDPDLLARAYALNGAANEAFPDGTKWAFGCVFSLVCYHPHAALEIIRLAVRYATTDIQLCMIGCGHLESLLGQHSKLVIGDVERLSREDPAFKECLSNVWQHGMPDEHWRRVLAASGR